MIAVGHKQAPDMETKQGIFESKKGTEKNGEICTVFLLATLAMALDVLKGILAALNHPT